MGIKETVHTVGAQLMAVMVMRELCQQPSNLEE